MKGSWQSPTHPQAAKPTFHSNQDTNPPHFHSLPSIKPLVNLPDQRDPSASFSKPNYLQKAGCEGDPGGKHSSYQPWQIPVVSYAWPPLSAALCPIFLCAALPLKAPRGFCFLPVTWHTQADWLWNAIDFCWKGKRSPNFYINLPKKLSKKQTKPLDARKSKPSSTPWSGRGGSLQRGWQMWPPS